VRREKGGLTRGVQNVSRHMRHGSALSLTAPPHRSYHCTRLNVKEEEEEKEEKKREEKESYLVQ